MPLSAVVKTGPMGRFRRLRCGPLLLLGFLLRISIDDGQRLYTSGCLVRDRAKILLSR